MSYRFYNKKLDPIVKIDFITLKNNHELAFLVDLNINRESV